MTNTAESKASIRTRYHCPTDRGGSYITATSDDVRDHHRVTVGYNYALNGDENHAAAAQAFFDKYMERVAPNHCPALYAIRVNEALVFDRDQYHAFETVAAEDVLGS